MQTAGSLAAILALAGLAWWLRLGPAPPLSNAEDVRRIAAEIEDGFAPTAIACDQKGAGALARDAQGRILLIRPHGNRFVGRVLTARACATLEGHPGEFNILIDSGERRFGRLGLTLPDPDAWAAAINALNDRCDA
ncbi:hypothetical protein [Porphyrobacter sp. AAP60]|uniref:hypothetical protein n=1 Tax=Porphyrobacter sp. AAP60 TaxID=1523423 RepID=UPI0006CCC159|nr:hypothetical protein [Porphyrobacter sp. AAP60]KPF62988.1 hypothetical protein IP79_10490 [Porphyrobacter sp. AAP60]